MREIARPAYFTVELLEPDQRPAPAREDGIRGLLSLTLTCRTPLHVGTGSPYLVEDVPRRLVGGMATVSAGSAKVPFIPGSSVKGAVRAVVEAITPSCERVSVPGRDGRGCQGADGLCPACQVFGAPGWRATVGFGDLVRVGSGGDLQPIRIAQRYSSRNAPRRGRRLYRPEPEDPLPAKEEELAVVPAGTRFRGAIYLDGIDETGLGLIFLALGVPPKGLPYLRLGAGKNRGLGIVEADVRFGRLYRSLRDWLSDTRLLTTPEDAGEFVSRLEEQALAVHPRTRDLVERIRREYAGPTEKNPR
jgi:CRISPR/Cas system CSM-associated protein Csm3 (group 7 of RAMP superfamily)